MENRFQMTSEGIIVSTLIVLTPSEQEKLECKYLERTITNIAKDLHVDWAVETSGNMCTATVSKTFGPVVGNAQVCEVEMAATKFMSAIRQLTIPCDKKPEKVKDADDVKCGDTVVVFTVDSNAERTIKALRECTNATLAIAKQYAEKGRIICSKDEAQSIIDNLEVAGAKNVHVDENLTNRLAFCKDIIDNWEDKDIQAYVCGADIMAKFEDLPGLTIQMGCISGDLLKDMFVTYIRNM